MVLWLGTAEPYQASENKNKVIYDESIETPIMGNLTEQQLPGYKYKYKQLLWYKYNLQIQVPEGYKYAKEEGGGEV